MSGKYLNGNDLGRRRGTMAGVRPAVRCPDAGGAAHYQAFDAREASVLDDVRRRRERGIRPHRDFQEGSPSAVAEPRVHQRARRLASPPAGKSAVLPPAGKPASRRRRPVNRTDLLTSHFSILTSHVSRLTSHVRRVHPPPLPSRGFTSELERPPASRHRVPDARDAISDHQDRNPPPVSGFVAIGLPLLLIIIQRIASIAMRPGLPGLVHCILATGTAALIAEATAGV
jgi:hypothetical protein